MWESDRGFRFKKSGTGDMVQYVKSLLHKYEDLSLALQYPHKKVGHGA